nr:hypothetical protein [Tanacetum cinerariifolium]
MAGRVRRGRPPRGWARSSSNSSGLAAGSSNVKEGLMDLMSGMVEEMLKTEDADDTILSEIMGGVAVDEESRALFDQILERIGVKKEGVVKSGNNDGKIRKMKRCVNELQMKDAQ